MECTPSFMGRTHNPIRPESMRPLSILILTQMVSASQVIWPITLVVLTCYTGFVTRRFIVEFLTLVSTWCFRPLWIQKQQSPSPNFISDCGHQCFKTKRGHMFPPVDHAHNFITVHTVMSMQTTRFWFLLLVFLFWGLSESLSFIFYSNFPNTCFQNDSPILLFTQPSH